MSKEEFEKTHWQKGDAVVTRYGGRNLEMSVRRIDFDCDMILVQSPSGDSRWCRPADIITHKRKAS